MSVVIDYLKLTYSNCCEDGSHSWQVINTAMKSALTTAIQGRFKFDADDFKYLSGKQTESGYEVYGRFGFYRWIGKDTAHGYGESYYKLAIDSGNKSACIAYEAWQERKPFIRDGKRLGVGSTFSFIRWGENMHWKVNSFSEDGKKINLSCGHERASLTPKDIKIFGMSNEQTNPLH